MSVYTRSSDDQRRGVTATEATEVRQVETEPITEPAVDKVRWGSILAGLFAALATLTILALLGLAIGLSRFNAGDQAGSFLIGAGIWGALSALVAFGVGGYVAAHTAGVRGVGNGLLNGGMVWAVSIPLLLYLLGGGIGSLLGVAGNAATTAAQVAAPAAAGVAAQPGAQATAQAGGSAIAGAAQATAQAVPEQVTPERVEQATDAAGKGAWGTLGSLILGLIAALAGGYLGSRRAVTERFVRRPGVA